MLFLLIGVIIALLLIVIAFMGGVLTNPYTVVKLRRQYLKEDFGIIKLLSKDRITFRTHILNLDAPSFELNGAKWINRKGFVFIENREDRGFNFRQVSGRIEEGLPCVYLDSQSLEPISLDTNISPIPPKEMGAWLRADSQLQIAKGLVNDRTQKQMQVAMIGLIVVIGLGLVVIYATTASIEENTSLTLQETQNIRMMLETVHGVSIQNGTIVYGG